MLTNLVNIMLYVKLRIVKSSYVLVITTAHHMIVTRIYWTPYFLAKQ